MKPEKISKKRVLRWRSFVLLLSFMGNCLANGNGKSFELDRFLKSTKLINQSDKGQKNLAIYQLNLKEAQNLQKLCQANLSTDYENAWDKTQAKRIMLANLQAFLLSHAVRDLVTFSNLTGIDKEKFSKLTESLVSKCSSNMTIISKKSLQKEMIKLFERQSPLLANHVANSEFFSPLHKRSSQLRDTDKELLVLTSNIFEAACSWNGDPEREQKLNTLMGDLFLGSHVINLMSDQYPEWNPAKKEAHLSRKRSPKVYCDGFVCREKRWKYFISKIPRSLGFRSIKRDFQSLYCLEFQNKPKNLDENQKRLISHAHTQVTKIPDFKLISPNEEILKEILLSSFNTRLARWQDETIIDTQKVSIEENLNLALIKRKENLQAKGRDLLVHFDLNYGEMDSSVKKTGKIVVGFEAEFLPSFLKWARTQWAIHHTSKESLQEPILKAVTGRILSQTKGFQENLDLRITHGSFSREIAREILDQLILGFGHFDKKTKLKVQLAYSPFALKYLARRYARENSRLFDLAK